MNFFRKIRRAIRRPFPVTPRLISSWLFGCSLLISRESCLFPEWEKLPRVWIIGKYGNLYNSAEFKSRCCHTKTSFPFICSSRCKIVLRPSRCFFLNFLLTISDIPSIDDRKCTTESFQNLNGSRVKVKRRLNRFSRYLHSRKDRSFLRNLVFSFPLSRQPYNSAYLCKTRRSHFRFIFIFAFLSKLYSNVG